MLIVLPCAPPRLSSTRPARVGPWNRSGGAVRLSRPSSSMIGDLVGRGCRRELQHALADRDRSRDRDRAGRRRVPSRDAGRVVGVHDLASRLHGGLRIGLVVLVDDLDGVVDAGLLHRRVDLIDRQVRGLPARRTVVRQVAGQRHDVADGQVERLLAAATAVVTTRGDAERGGENDACGHQRQNSCSPQSPSSSTHVSPDDAQGHVGGGRNATRYRKGTIRVPILYHRGDSFRRQPSGKSADSAELR